MQPRVSCLDVVSPNQLFEHFILLEMLGRGGMGEVWSAHDTELDRSVALKFLRAETAPELDTAHIAREAKAASALNHPNIVSIHEVVRSKSCSAIVMEQVQGSSFAKLGGASLPIPEVRSIGAQIAKAFGPHLGRTKRPVSSGSESARLQNTWRLIRRLSGRQSAHGSNAKKRTGFGPHLDGPNAAPVAARQDHDYKNGY